MRATFQDTRKFNRNCPSKLQPFSELFSWTDNINNPYTKFRGEKCYKCGSFKHATGVCRGRKTVTRVEEELEMVEGGMTEEDYEEAGDELALVLQHVLYSKPNENTQRHQIL